MKINFKFSSFSLKSAEDKIVEDAFFGNKKIVVTPNVDFLDRYVNEKDLIFNNLLDNADYVFCDSRIIKSIKNSSFNLITGSDLTKNILSNQKTVDLKIVFIGPQKKHSNFITTQYGLNNVLSLCPNFGFERSNTELNYILSSVHDFKPNIIFLALGSPKQELLCDLMLKDNISSVFMNVGASLDFLSGSQKRSPLLLQKCGLEWLHRLITRPTLWRRYKSNFKFIVKTNFLRNIEFKE